MNEEQIELPLDPPPDPETARQILSIGMMAIFSDLYAQAKTAGFPDPIFYEQALYVAIYGYANYSQFTEAQFITKVREIYREQLTMDRQAAQKDFDAMVEGVKAKLAAVPKEIENES